MDLLKLNDYIEDIICDINSSRIINCNIPELYIYETPKDFYVYQDLIIKKLCSIFPEYRFNFLVNENKLLITSKKIVEFPNPSLILFDSQKKIYPTINNIRMELNYDFKPYLLSSSFKLTLYNFLKKCMNYV